MRGASLVEVDADNYSREEKDHNQEESNIEKKKVSFQGLMSRPLIPKGFVYLTHVIRTARPGNQRRMLIREKKNGWASQGSRKRYLSKAPLVNPQFRIKQTHLIL